MMLLAKVKVKKGFTLVETIVAVALLSLVTLLIVTVLVTSTGIIGKQALSKRNSENAAAGIEQKMAEPLATLAPAATGDVAVLSQQNSTFTVSFNGVVINADGKLVTSNDNSGSTTYYYFIPN